jgi:hypothetical protein
MSENCQCQLPVVSGGGGNVSAMGCFGVLRRARARYRPPFGVQREGKRIGGGGSVLARRRSSIVLVLVVLVDCFPHEQNDHDHDDEDDHEDATRFSSATIKKIEHENDNEHDLGRQSHLSAGN